MFLWQASMSLTSGVFMHVTYLSVECGLWHNQQSSSVWNRKYSMSDRRYSLAERRCIVYDRRYSLSDTSSRLYERRCSLYDPISSLSSKKRASLQPCGTVRELWNPLLSGQVNEPIDDNLVRAATSRASRRPSWDMEDLLLVSGQSRGRCDLDGPLVERSGSIFEEEEDEEDMDMGESDTRFRLYDRRCSLYDASTSLSGKRRTSLQPCGTVRELWNPLLSGQVKEPVDDDLMRAATRRSSRCPSWDMEDLLLVSRQSRGPCDLGGPLVERSSSIVEEEGTEDMDMGESRFTGRVQGPDSI